jgi:hypothetical protein
MWIKLLYELICFIDLPSPIDPVLSERDLPHASDSPCAPGDIFFSMFFIRQNRYTCNITTNFQSRGRLISGWGRYIIHTFYKYLYFIFQMPWLQQNHRTTKVKQLSFCLIYIHILFNEMLFYILIGNLMGVINSLSMYPSGDVFIFSFVWTSPGTMSHTISYLYRVYRVESCFPFGYLFYVLGIIFHLLRPTVSE